MRQPRVQLAWRHGLRAAAVIAVLTSVDAAVQARRRAIGPSAHGLVVFTYLLILALVLLLLAAGFAAARSTGRARAGAAAGAIAVGAPWTLVVLVLTLQTATGHRPLTGLQVVGYVVAFLLFAAAGALVGAIVSLPGALVGRACYRREHAAELAALAAELAARDEARRAAASRRGPKKKGDTPWAFVWLMVAAIGLIAFVPALAAQWAFEGAGRWQGLGLAGAALVVGIILLKAAAIRGRLGYVLDWLGVMGLCFAAMLAIAELTGFAVLLIPGAGMLLYIWRSFDRSMRTVLPPPAETPERPPVWFRHDGQSIVVYPSRRKLAAHAAFAGGVALVAAALAVRFRAAGPDVVFALGAFAALGLFGFVPDLVRLVHRWPALIVSSDGVTDLASAHVLGFGRIPWHEIIGVVNAGTLRGGRFPELAIIPVSYHRLLASQPLLKRPFLRLGSAMGGGAIYISSVVLSQPPSELARRIGDFVKSHAPAGYIEPDEYEDDAGAAAEEAR